MSKNKFSLVFINDLERMSSNNMESEILVDPYEDNRAVSRQSVHSTKKDSHSVKNYNLSNEEEKQEIDSRSKTRIYHSDPDRDQISDEDSRRSKKSYYSDDYDSPSDRSLSPYSRSRSPSPTPQRKPAKRVLSSPPYKTGVGRKGAPRPQRAGRQYGSQQLRKGAHSQSKESSPSKDLDLVTKRMLSARLLKINELRNALAELQQHVNELRKENRVLRQLQLRQEKALHRYDDTESEISQLISRHSNEVHVLRERLRRTQERERTVERRLKDSEGQLLRSQATVARLKKLVNQRDLGQRDELTRKLDEEKGLRQEAERKIKELERSVELSAGSFQRQLMSEKKKAIITQEEVRTLQEEVERLTNKLKEKDRELDAKNIYANRMSKLSQRKDTDSGTKRKFLSRMSTVAVQTEDRQELSSLGFPTPPPAITDAHEYNEYLSLKDLNKDLQSQHKQSNQTEVQLQEKAQTQQANYKQHLSHESNLHDETQKTLKEEWKREMNGDVASPIDQKMDEKSPRPGHVQGEVQRLNQETLTNQQAAEEADRKKEHLLAKMREIDQQNQPTNDHIFNEPKLTKISEQSRSTSVFNLTQTDNLPNTGHESREVVRRRAEQDSGGVTTGLGRRAFRTQTSSDDLAFGSYAPSFGHTASRGIYNLPPTPPKEDKGSALAAIGVFSIKKTAMDKEKDIVNKVEKDRKSSLMQQLFGNIAITDNVKSNNKDLLSSPSSTNGVRSRREVLHSLHSGSHTPPTAAKSTIQIAETKPAICAITSFDDDIEELTL